MPSTDGDVVSFERPPIRQGVTVRSDVAHTFDVFVRRLGEWWPLKPYSLGGDSVTSVSFDQRLGGRIHETWRDGTEVTWGHVVAWDPPAGFTMTWEVMPVVTEVTVSFRALGPIVTRVEVEHRGWDRLTVDDYANATAVPGGYDAGWAAILAALASAVRLRVR